MTKSETLRMAAHLEELAKDEECGFVEVVDTYGRRKRFNRYLLPYVAEGLRISAYFMKE